MNPYETFNSSTAYEYSTAANSAVTVYEWWQQQRPDDGGAGVREPRRPRTPLLPGAIALEVPA